MYENIWGRNNQLRLLWRVSDSHLSTASPLSKGLFTQENLNTPLSTRKGRNLSVRRKWDEERDKIDGVQKFLAISRVYCPTTNGVHCALRLRPTPGDVGENMKLMKKYVILTTSTSVVQRENSKISFLMDTTKPKKVPELLRE
ncbi:hypothetical protein JTB14_006951 [Gonioctena quinquepunctata]|nr:hypothetical protein JTB14_006951 [Gonioctena quinquepunctata]